MDEEFEGAPEFVLEEQQKINVGSNEAGLIISFEDIALGKLASCQILHRHVAEFAKAMIDLSDSWTDGEE